MAINGAELTRELAKSGTGSGKLAVCRQLLADVYQSEHRTASAAEVVEALEASGVAGEVTIAKARELAGLPRQKAPGAPADTRPIELILLGETAVGPLDADDKPPAKAPEVAKPKGDEDGEYEKGPAPEFVGPKKFAVKPPVPAPAPPRTAPKG